ncbi:MAG: transglutaminase family protein [Acidimicrobiales bacterium]
MTLDDEPIAAVELDVHHGGRIHLVNSGAGRLAFTYRAVVVPMVAPDRPAAAAEALVALRQSRYSPSDVLEGFAAGEFAALGPDAPDRARAVGEWVFERLRYELGSTGPFESAVDTLLRGEGVCRDFAHLTVGLCRAIGLPARLASVYAPGLSPMDFHAVAEVLVEGRWQVIDATRLAPRQSLLRIATGRDAADTAFCSTLSGSAELLATAVGAATDADLPSDDHVAPVHLA